MTTNKISGLVGKLSLGASKADDAKTDAKAPTELMSPREPEVPEVHYFLEVLSFVSLM